MRVAGRPLQAIVGRRQALQSFLVGAGAVGLRALASGVPPAILLDPRRALGQTICARPPQYLILSTSADGDPMGCNVPGTYDDPEVVHPPTAAFRAASITQSGVARQGAAIWGSLPGALLDRTCFFHHGTYTVVHGDNNKTLGLQGAVSGFDMVVSMAARQLASCLKTVQQDPISIGAQHGSEALSAQQRVLPILPPRALQAVLVPPDGPLSKLQPLRDQTLDKLHAWVKARGVDCQSNFIDRYATSQGQLRQVSDALFNNLAAIKDNGVASQIAAAIILIRMHVSAVVAIKVPFGGDNHSDGGLQVEADQTISGVASLAQIFAQLGAVGLQDQVSFAGINVFGRTMSARHEGTTGRDHNGNHHATIICGANVRGGVVGGIEPVGGDYGASTFSSRTGAVDAGGDVPLSHSLAAMGRTLGAAVGLDESILDANISGGTTVTAALAR